MDYCPAVTVVLKIGHSVADVKGKRRLKLSYYSKLFIKKKVSRKNVSRKNAYLQSKTNRRNQKFYVLKVSKKIQEAKGKY